MAMTTKASCLSALIAGALMLGGTQTAHAWTGQDPYLSGCSVGAYPIQYDWIVGELQLATWYSPRCNARYISLNMQQYPAWYTRPTSIYIHNAFSGAAGARTWSWGGNGWYYSNLIALSPSGSNSWAPCGVVRRVDGSVLSNCSYYVVVK